MIKILTNIFPVALGNYQHGDITGIVSQKLGTGSLRVLTTNGVMVTLSMRRYDADAYKGLRIGMPYTFPGSDWSES